MKVVVVHWLDAVSDRGQLTLKQVENMKPVPIVSAGLLIKNDERGVIFTQDFMWDGSDGDEEYRSSQMIPKAYITSIEIKDFDGHSND